MLLCGIIDNFQELQPAINISYFFCQATDLRINTAIAVLRSLIYLLIDQQRSLISHIRDKYDQAGNRLFEDVNAWVALSAILKDILQDPGLKSTYIIIDALDECITDLPKLLNIILELLPINPTVKWIVSSRNWSSIEKTFSKAAQKIWISLELNRQSVSAAVATYIKFKVQSLSEENNYNSSIRDTINHYLTANSNGTFLWVALVCHELAGISDWEVEGIMAEFPPGLNNLYKRMMDNIISRYAPVCKSILAALLLMYRPISLDELACLVELPPSVSSNRKALAEIIGFCGSFLTLQDQTVFFIHQSAKDFLSENESRSLFPSGIEVGHQSIFSRSIKAMSQILQRDIYNLIHPGISIEEVKIPRPDPLSPIRYACTYWVDHLCEIQSSYSNSLIDTFLKEHYLYWLEALSLTGNISEGVLAILKLITLLKVSNYAR